MGIYILVGRKHRWLSILPNGSSQSRLPSLSSVNSSPRILTFNLEDIIVVYAIPLNENRGIYLTNSSDGGVTWSDPYLVVDATAQGWDRVDDPRLARTNDGRLHVLWIRFNLLNSDESEGNPSALYYATSDDNGVTWTLPQEFASADIQWSEILSPDGQQVHRLWQEEVGGSSLVWHEVSVDAGLSWFRTSIFSSTVVENDFISVVPDPSGALHFIRISKVAADTWSLGYWNWDGGSWTKLDTIELVSEENENVIHQVSAYNPNGLLAVSYSTLRETEEIDDIAFTFMQRAPDQTSIVGTGTVQTPDSLSTASTLQPDETLQTTEIIADGTSEPILPDATPSPAIIEGTAVVPQQSDGPPPSQDNTTLGLIVSIIVALIVAGLGIGIGLLRRRS